MRGQGEQDRRDQECAGDALLLQNAQKLLQVEPRHADQGRPTPQSPPHQQAQAIHMEERQHRDQPILRPGRQDSIPLDQGGGQVAVSKHDALGQPGGPTGVGKGHQISGRVDPDGWRCRPGGSEQAGERSRALRLAEYEDLLHARAGGRIDRPVQQRQPRWAAIGDAEDRTTTSTGPGRLRLQP
jgi:hypothetical protein